jgi:parvulin-like peptidyl-prolyl isomerase
MKPHRVRAVARFCSPLLICSALLMGTLLLPTRGSAQTTLINRIVLRVNDRIATLADFQRLLAERRQAIAGEETLDPQRRQELLGQAGLRVMEEMYEEMLLLSRADQLAVHASEADVDKQVAEARERMGIQTDAQFAQALTSSGITEDQLRDRMRRNLLVQQLMAHEVQPRIKIDEDEIRRYWREHPGEFTVAEAVGLQEVVLLDPENGKASPEEAEQLRAELTLGGSNMGSVIDHWKSEGKINGLSDLGWVEKGDLDPALEAAAWNLEDGAISAPVPGRGGLHLLRLSARRPAAVLSFDQAKEEISRKEGQKRMATEYRVYLKELEGHSYITMKLPPEAEGFKGLSDGPPSDEIDRGIAAPVDPAAAAPAPAEAEPSPAEPAAATPVGSPSPSG